MVKPKHHFLNFMLKLIDLIFTLFEQSCRTSECSFQVGPVLIVDEPFTVIIYLTVLIDVLALFNLRSKKLETCMFYDTTLQIDNGLMTPTMKIRRDKVVAKYKDEISQLYN